MIVESQEFAEYPFEGVFYEYTTNTSGGLLDQTTEEVEVLRTKCDIQQNTFKDSSGFLTSSYSIYFPLEPSSLFPSSSEEEVANEEENVSNEDSLAPIKIKRGMYFRGYVYGYEVNGKVKGVGFSMLGGCECQIEDLDE